MINYHKNFRSLLKAAAPNVEVYYEAFKEKRAVPCISYMESSNTDNKLGDTLDYSDLSFMVKVWAESIDETQTIAAAIDTELKANGFSRVMSNDLFDNGLCMKVMRYKALGYEYK